MDRLVRDGATVRRWSVSAQHGRGLNQRRFGVACSKSDIEDHEGLGPRLRSAVTDSHGAQPPEGEVSANGALLAAHRHDGANVKRGCEAATLSDSCVGFPLKIAKNPKVVTGVKPGRNEGGVRRRSRVNRHGRHGSRSWKTGGN